MAMNEWNGMAFEGKDNLLRVVRREADGMFAMAERPDAWEAPTRAGDWQVRDVIGHLVDTTEAYFQSFDMARGNLQAWDAYGLPGMAARVNEQATAFRGTPQPEMMERLRTDFEKMMGIFDALGPDEWGALMVPHFYMGPLPAFFYPAFQLMDYGVHSWDIREGTGRSHGLAGDVGDLLAPFMLVLWSATTKADPDAEEFEVGIRVTSGPNAGDYRVKVGASGFVHEVATVDNCSAVFEFDPGSLVLTAFGRANAGSYRGDAAVADRYLNLFFRI
jgi:uncharacterized protein (TIGR03083 family)